MEYRNTFELISEEFNKEKIPCILVGGFAVNLYNYPRNTSDIDFMIAEHDLERSKKILFAAGYSLYHAKDAFAQFKPNESHLQDLDLILVDNSTFEEIAKNAKTVTFLNRQFLVPSLNHLIAMKLHAIKSGSITRELKDLLDVVTLIKANNIDFRSQDFRNLVLQFGNEIIFQKIIAAFE